MGRSSSTIAGLDLVFLVHGIERSNAQIAQELAINPNDAQRMTEQRRDGMDVVAGHQGHPATVKKRVGRADGGA